MITYDLTRVFFWCVAIALLGSSTIVVTCRRPMLSIVSLIQSFILAAILWMMVGAEFLSLGLIFVYVGAVMTLFLFVVMMLNQEKVAVIRKRLLVWPGAALIFALLSFIMMHALQGSAVWTESDQVGQLNHIPNVEAIGRVLYTQYALSFETAALILLVAMLAAITLTFRGAKPGSKHQKISSQININKADRIELVDLKEE